jgi:SAM-dependent methyltransferase
MNTLTKLIESGIYKEGDMLKLNLGCGSQYLNWYINIDHPVTEHTASIPRVDAYGDITTLDFPDNSVDEIKLLHVLEHFDRVTALVLLVRWQRWLKIDGVLVIETPDILESAKQLASDITYEQKMAIIRHLEGDQAAKWATHIGQWFDERFENTLSKLGFHITSMDHSQWTRWPYLSNITVTATKLRNIDLETQIEQSCLLLKDSMVSPSEHKTFAVWERELRKGLDVL